MAGEESQMDQEDDLPGSQFSLGSLHLSQGTFENLMEAVRSDIVDEVYLTEDLEDNSNNLDGCTISIQRSIITTPSNNNMQNTPSSQQFVLPTCTGYIPPPLHHNFSEANSMVSSTNTTPTRITTPNVSPGMSECSSSSYRSSMPYLQNKIPSNMPFPGEYGFSLVLPDDDDKPSKTTPFTYSNITKRAYIRRDTTIAFTFVFSSKVPAHSVIRAMAIHKTAELLGDVLQCCPKHIEEQRLKGHAHPRHFICGASKSEAVYCEDPISGRLSITIPISSLQQKSENSVQSFFVFPCFTSEIHRGPGQLAQLIFTLEIEGHVVGRAVLDVRVCASTGRDRDNDETKLSPCEGGDTTAVRQSRKRPSSLTQNVECTLPTKMMCPSTSGQRTKEQYVIETFPELFPFVDVCIKMIERVYTCKIQMTPQGTSSSSDIVEQRPVTETYQPPSPDITSIDSWLQFLNLTQYGPMLERHGVCSLSQAISLTDDQLLALGVKDKNHRDTFIDGIKYIKTAEEPPLSQSTQPYIPQLLSQISSVSSASNNNSQTLDVLRIQLKKTISSSSSSSSET